MNTKRFLIQIAVLLALLVIALGFIVFTNRAPAPVVPGQPPQAQTSPVLGGTATTSGTYEYTEDTQYYTVDALYPAQLPLPAAASQKAELVVEQGIANDISQFKKDSDLDNITPADAQVQGLGPDTKYAFGATYEQYQSSTTVSYVFLIYEDTLGAHPNTFYSTFTFDQQGNQLQLADLFKPGAAYLPALSTLAYQGVVAQLTEREGSAPVGNELDTVRMGTEPSPEALQFFYIDGTTLHLLFPPYQVASYAAGAFDVPIPLSQLTGILK